MYKAIDVFSGTGGISLALKEFNIATVQYCEINSYSQKVLTERMLEGKIDKAPIHSDIRTLHVSPHTNLDMIFGGSPCTDLSSIGLRKGIIKGPQSSLFFEIIRIIDECPSIKIVFLENVANIIKCCIEEVINALISRGFDIFWILKSAASEGAPHLRNRWFCLATRNEKPNIVPIIHNVVQLQTNWDNEPDIRVVFRPSSNIKDDLFDTHWIQRSQCLGNAVVPIIVNLAFKELLHMHKNWTYLKEHLSEEFRIPLHHFKGSYPEIGIIMDSCFYIMPSKISKPIKNHQIDIKINDTLTFGNYPTPRHGVSHATNLSERSIHDLPTVLINTLKSKEYIKQFITEIPDKLYTILIPNINYIEWLMGYEKDWTRLKNIVKTQEIVPSTSLEIASEEHEKGDAVIAITKKWKGNGLHLYMKEVHPGKPVKEIIKYWHDLPENEKVVFKNKAKVLSGETSAFDKT